MLPDDTVQTRSSYPIAFQLYDETGDQGERGKRPASAGFHEAFSNEVVRGKRKSHCTLARPLSDAGRLW